MGLNEVPLWHYGVDAMTFQIFTGGDFCDKFKQPVVAFEKQWTTFCIISQEAFPAFLLVTVLFLLAKYFTSFNNINILQREKQLN